MQACISGQAQWFLSADYGVKHLLLRKKRVINCLLWEINHKFVFGSQPKAVGGGGAEALGAAAERETHAERQAQASREGGR